MVKVLKNKRAKGKDMEMKYNFDEVIDRYDTNSVKYENAKEEEPDLKDDFIPLWIADMDFACPPEVIKAMHERLDRKILGYSDILDSKYMDAVKNWMYTHYEWIPPMDHMVISPGVVPAISNLIQLLTDENDKVLILTPSYKPFYSAIVNNKRIPIYSSLIYEDKKYKLDFENLERQLQDANLFVFCSPHNPTGRIWTEEELRKVVALCEKESVPIICDEIHQDIHREGKQYIPLMKLFPEKNFIYTCTAPSKTFNMAGNHLSNIFIPNNDILKKWCDKFYYLPNPLSIAATEAAYSKGSEWVKELNMYIDKNFEFIKNFFERYMPKIQFEIPEGTYLAWFNMKNYGLSDKDVHDIFIKDAGVFIEGAGMFVKDDEDWIRMNIACPKVILEQALNRMKDAFANN